LKAEKLIENNNQCVVKMGLGQKILIRFGLCQFAVAQVGSAIFGLGLENLKKILLESKRTGVKDGSALIYLGSKV